MELVLLIHSCAWADSKVWIGNTQKSFVEVSIRIKKGYKQKPI